MKPLRLAVGVLSCFVAVQSAAQETAEPAVDPGSESSIEERVCIPIDEVEQSPGEESGPSQEEAGDEGESTLPVCEEPVDAAPAEDEAVEEPDPPAEEAGTEEAGEEENEAEETDDGEEADPGQEFEVDPEDEISEDYPVPLPSDI